MRRANGATLIELLIALGVAVTLAIAVWEMFISGRRGMARGEAKLDYLSDANIAFLTLQRDLHASVSDPEIVGGSVLVVRRFQIAPANAPMMTQVINYAREEASDPKDTALERRITSGASPEDERVKRLCRGSLQDFKVAMKDVNGVKALEVILVFKGVQDNEETRFRRLFTARNAVVDETWIPVKK